jgi:hypothetical protein
MTLVSLTLLSLTVVSLYELAIGPSSALAQPIWAIDRMTVQDVSPGTAETFRQILRSKLAAGNGARYVDLNYGCTDATCARNAAAPALASTVVFGSLGRLGTKIVVTVTAVEVGSGAVATSESFSVDREEELDLAAARLAEAVLRGRRVEQTAELGATSREEAAAPGGRDTRVAVSLGVEGIFPVKGFAEQVNGAGFLLGLWFEAMDFAIEPRIGWRTELGGGGRDWDHLVLELSAAWLILRGDITPVIGGGVGLQYLNEKVPVSREVGSVLVSRTTDVIEDSLVGFGAFGRVGVMLLRTYDVSLLVAVDYAVTVADFQERDDEQALRATIDLIIGGS